MPALTARPRSLPPRVAAHPPVPPPARTVAALVLANAARTPDRVALVLPTAGGGAAVVRYGELARGVAEYAAGLQSAGVGGGQRVLVLAPPSPELHALALALLANGSTLVLVDGQLSPRRLLGALDDARPHVVVAPPRLLCWWPLVRALRGARRVSTAGRVPGATPLAALRRAGAAPPVPVADGALPALVSFTSGSSGRAKGVVRTHAVLLAQHLALRAAFPVRPDDVHLTSLPGAALHGLCCGTTTVVCAPAATPADRHALLVRHGATSVSGAPAVMGALAARVLAVGAPAAGVRRVVVGGGPAPRLLCAALARAFPAARGHVVYGATEAEPIAAAPLAAAASDPGAGFLVGRVVAGVQVALVAPGAPVPRGAGAAPPAPGECGEVVVRGARVTAWRVGGAPDEGGWHRTGDLARVDGRGRLWLLGGVAAAVHHRGRALHPYPVEAAALDVPGVRAAGLVAHRRAPDGELAVARAAGADARAVACAVRAALDAAGLAAVPLRVVAEIPMDARHASKVQRAALVRRLAWWPR